MVAKGESLNVSALHQRLKWSYELKWFQVRVGYPKRSLGSDPILNLQYG